MSFNSVGKGKRIILWIVASVAFLVSVGMIWYTNILVPIMMDDEWYATVLYSDKHIESMRDILDAQIWHYNNWGGRTVNHTILQLVLLAGTDVANLLNTVWVVLTAILLVFIAETMTQIRHGALERMLLIDGAMGMMLGLNANWKMSMFWQSGAANYLYITVFILLFLWVYLREIPYECFGSKAPLPGVGVWIIPLSLIAGWSNENMGPVAFIFSIATIIYVKRVGHVVHAWMIEGSIFSFAGSVMCILAPGNFARVEEVPSSNYGFVWKAYLHGYYESTALLEYLLPAIITLIGVWAVGKAVNIHKFGIEIDFVLTAAVLSWGAMVLSPHYPDRATYGTLILMLVGIMAMGYKIFERKPAIRNCAFWGILLIWCRGMYKLAEYMGVCRGWIL